MHDDDDVDVMQCCCAPPVTRLCLGVASVRNGIGDAVTLHSEDLAYAFGAPLVDGLGPFSSSGFTRADRVFSEFVLRYWTNFMKTGLVMRVCRQLAKV